MKDKFGFDGAISRRDMMRLGLISAGGLLVCNRLGWAATPALQPATRPAASACAKSVIEILALGRALPH